MKYYCKNCGSVLEVGHDVNLPVNPNGKELVKCSICTDFDEGECDPVYMEKIPDYETPEQHEQRTGEAYPDDGAVFYLITVFGKTACALNGFNDTKQIVRHLPEQIVVIADPPVPPPEDWRPQS